MAARAPMWSALPAGLTAAVTLVDYQPRLRAMVESRVAQEIGEALEDV